MVTSWETCSLEIKDFVFHLLNGTKNIVEDNFVGFYVHGSLAMGGFNPASSDVDVLVVTKKPLTVYNKRLLAQFYKTYSNKPFPVEISILSQNQLNDWQHPCPFEFHYSEFWRERYEEELSQGTYQYLNDDEKKDCDLAAHITITNFRGICVHGKPTNKVFPLVPRKDYISSIMGDFEECLENIEEKPIYCILNLLRVYLYVKEEVISSKQEAADWGIIALPEEMKATIQKARNCYAGENQNELFENKELAVLRDYLSGKVHSLIYNNCNNGICSIR